MSADEIHMTRALEVATDGMRLGEMPIGAVVAVDGEVIAEAHTQERTQNRLLVHADLLALDAADSLLAGRRARATLYVTLEPCIMCLGAAFTMRIGAVVYALESPSDGGCRALLAWAKERKRDSMPGYNVPTIRSGPMRRQSASLFRQYAATASPGWSTSWAEELATLGGS